MNIIFSQNLVLKLVFFIFCTYSVSIYLGGPIYYGALVGIFAILVVLERKKYVYPNCLLILLIAILSTIVNYPSTPEIFRPFSRMVMLTIVMVACAPIYNSHRIYKLRHKFFGGISFGLCAVGVISALLATRGWGFWESGNFLVGLSDYPNNLGYSLAIAVMFLCSYIKGASIYIKILFLFLIGLCIWAIPLTGTRTAFFSLPIFLLVYIFLISKNTKEIIKTVSMVIAILFVFLSNVKLDTSIIESKNNSQNLSDNSRTSLYEARIREFKEHPILGIGTFVVDMRWAPVTKNGNTEAGNTFLMFLSMNGIIGFINLLIFYISIVIPFIKYILKKRKLGTITSFEIYLTSIVLYNFINMMQWGILLNSGLYATALNWLSLALIYQPHRYLKNTSENIIL